MKGSTNGVIHRVRHLLGRADRTTDAELMARFIADRDADAFALLVRRHGPMVHGVCRRVLRNAADADDAFQATFLILARRARSVRRQRLLGNWLYGVAYRTALEARRAAAVRRVRERRAAEMKHASAQAEQEADPATPDLREVLDRELAALPDVYRTAIVLCDLEGLSRKDAAERLGWREGTLSGRLFRARSLLAARLARLGLAVPAAGLGVVATAPAAVPTALAESTVRIGVLVAAGEAVAIAAAPVAALSEGVMKAMLLTKLKGLATVMVVSCAVLATSAAGWRANAVGASAATVVDGQSPGEPARRAAQRDPDKDRIAQLERERDELLKVVRELEARLEKLAGNQKGEARARVAEEKERAALEARRANEMKLRGLPKALEGKVPPEVLDKLKTLELEFDGKSADKKAAIEDLVQKLKAVEFDAAKLAKLKEFKETDLADKLKAMQLAAETAAKLKAREDNRSGRAKDLSGDRVGALEDRVKSMEADLKKLLVELERQRRTK